MKLADSALEDSVPEAGADDEPDEADDRKDLRPPFGIHRPEYGCFFAKWRAESKGTPAASFSAVASTTGAEAGAAAGFSGAGAGAVGVGTSAGVMALAGTVLAPAGAGGCS
jgi:hypothetical protein